MPPGDCQQLCFAATRCAVQAEPQDTCPGIWFVEFQSVLQTCTTLCTGNADVAARLGGDCDASVAALRTDPAFDDLCRNGTPLPPAVPQCAAAGRKIASCLTATCANAGAIEDGVAKLLDLGCRGAIAAGQLTAEQAGAVDADTPCDDAVVSGQVQGLLMQGEPRLFLPPFSDLCASGPAVPDGTCGALCANATACAPATSPLADADICLAACLPQSSEDDVEEAECAGAAQGCNAFAACYTGG
jgi:hypothetical protein